MKIIHVIPTLSSGGAERFTVDICNQLHRYGHSVVICVLSPLTPPDNFYLDQLSDGIRIKSFNKALGFSIKTVYLLTKFIHDEKPDVVHTHLRALAYTALAEVLFVKGIHTVHSEAHIEAYDRINTIVRKILFKSNRVVPVAISPESFTSFKDYYGFDPILVPNGRNVPGDLSVSYMVKKEFLKYRRDEKTRVIVHLAHLDRVKRQALHAHVASRLYREGFNFSILFIGSTRDENYTQIVEEALPPCAFILGERNNPLEYLKEAGAFALCSLYEGLPISLIEALGVGAIPICMPLGGIPNLVVDGSNGILSTDCEEESFYQAEKRYLSLSEREIEEMSHRAKDSYAPYTMEECANKYLQIYQTILKK